MSNNQNDIDLFKKYQNTKILDENGKIVKFDLKLRNNLAERNAKLVTFVINKFYSKKQKHKELRSDLLQEGHLGLFDAIDGFKPELGFKFSTYATWWIRQSVNSFLLDGEPLLHIPSHVRTARNKIFNLAKERNISIKDVDKQILEEIGMTEKMFESVNIATKTKAWNPQSLDEPISASIDNKTLKDILPCEKLDLGSILDNKKIIEIARKVFKTLDEREQYVLLERYGIDSGKIILGGVEK
jgi:RNA polymerase nonessential primary-like sigma factor